MARLASCGLLIGAHKIMKKKIYGFKGDFSSFVLAGFRLDNGSLARLKNFSDELLSFT